MEINNLENVLNNNNNRGAMTFYLYLCFSHKRKIPEMIVNQKIRNELLPLDYKPSDRTLLKYEENYKNSKRLVKIHTHLCPNLCR